MTVGTIKQTLLRSCADMMHLITCHAPTSHSRQRLPQPWHTWHPPPSASRPQPPATLAAPIVWWLFSEQAKLVGC